MCGYTSVSEDGRTCCSVYWFRFLLSRSIFILKLEACQVVVCDNIKHAMVLGQIIDQL